MIKNSLSTLFSNLSVKKKMIVLIFFSGILPLLITMTVTYSNLRNKAMEDAENELISSVSKMCNSIDSIINPISQTISILYTDSELEQQLSHEYKTDIEYVRAYYQVRDKSKRIMLSNSNIADIIIYTDNPSIFPNGHFIRKYKESFSSHEQDSGLVFFPSNDFYNNTIVFGQQLNYGHLNNPYGFLQVSINESVLDNLYINTLNSTIYTYTNDGTILSSTNKSSIGNNVFQIYDLSGNIQSSVPFTLQVNSDNFICIKGKPSSNMNILIMSPYRTVYGQVNDTMFSIILTMLFSLFVSILLTMCTSNYFSKCIHDLISQIQKINIHNLSFVTNNNSKDEIGQISNAVSQMSNSLERAINDVYIKELQKKETELQLLQSQINPHLLYNSIGSITAMALRQGNKDVADFTKHLAKFYKLSLSKGRSFISIQEEIELTDHYIQIQKVRFSNSFEFKWEIDSSILDFITPKLILQPFIENIINHAYKEKTVNVLISIKAYGDTICFMIDDDGTGIKQEVLDNLLNPQKAKGFGVGNVNQRIKLAFSDAYGVSINSKSGEGTRVTVTIPKTIKEKSNVD